MAEAAATTEATTETAAVTTETTTTETPETDDVEKWKALSRKNERDLRKVQLELEKARQEGMSEQEQAVAKARAEGRADAMKAVNERLLHAEVRAVAAGVLADPDDAIHLLDLSHYEPDADGSFDRKVIAADLARLVEAKPYLSPQPGNGSGEGGPRGTTQTTPLNGDPLLESLKSTLGIR